VSLTWRELRDEAVARLHRAGREEPALDVARIVERAAGLSPSALVTALDDPATTRQVRFFDQMVARSEAGEPLQYVLGRWGFRSLEVLVDRRALIPRPETEVVAGIAIDALRSHLERSGPGPTRDRPSLPGRNAGAGLVAVDLGTGSGVIALSIAAETWPRVDVWATDASPAALDLASANLAGLGRRAAVVRLAEGSWFDALPGEVGGRVDVVVANPPYVAEGDPLPSEVADWEPVQALVAGPTGLEAIEQIVGTAPKWLAPDGVLVVEIGETQGEAVLELARGAGFTRPEVRPDLTGRDRVLVATT
jgi:release factor glutamine methyltransferase